MGRSDRVDFSGCSILESPNYLKDLKKILKKHRSAEDNLCEFKKFIVRNGIMATLRYELICYNYKCYIYYSRWVVDNNAGKSGNARIWFAYIPEKKTLVFLSLYKHSQGTNDILKTDVEKIIKHAINYFFE